MKIERLRLFHNSLFMVSLFFFSACSSPGDKPGEESKPVVHTVEIVGMQFKPQETRAKFGDEVVFINHDIVAHDITEESKKAWHSSPLQDGQQWSLKIGESVNYYCSIHPVMKGRIIVE